MRARRLRAGLAALAWLLSAATPAAAHRLAPSLLEVRELEPGRVAVRWKTPLWQGAGAALRPELPARCEPTGPPRAGGDATSATLHWTLRCGEAGLVGAVFGVAGLAESRTEALLRVELADGRRVQAVLRADAPSLAVPPRARPGRVALDYAALGFRHILEGADHLLFVLGLLLLVPTRRALVATVSAFTLGHSVTLSLAALGFLGLPARLVELAIAGSILVLALELARPRAGRTGRRPGALAGLFGLLHGLGFAGALAEVGLPAGEIPLALLCFNLGIELGQLAFVAALLALAALARPAASRAPAWTAQLPAYAIGSLAAYWCLERALALL